MTCKVPHRNVLVAVAQYLINYRLQQCGCCQCLHPDMTSGRGGYMTQYNIGR